jgi:protein-S-isoprenylcysteine O-methyltransferase Ste14
MTKFSKIKASREGITTEKSQCPSLLKKFQNLLGVGPHMLLLGLLLEGLTIVIRKWFSFYISINFEFKVIITVTCVTLGLLGMIWFSRSLNLIEVNLLGEEKKLITTGPFNFVRHPLYSTLLLTIPPLMIIWYSDFLFLIPWILLFILSHYLVALEERGLIKTFGEEYEKYRKFVPSLLPYKGSGGKRYRESCI